MASVAVIGAGIIGLSSAVSILERDPSVKVTLLADRFSQDTTSNGAAGLIMPFVMGDTPGHLLRKWYSQTMNELDKLLKGQDAGDLSIYMMSGTEAYDKPKEEPHWKDLVDGYHLLSQKELNKFPKSARFGYGFTAYFINGKGYLPALMEKFKRLGGTVEKRTVKSLEEFSGIYDVVVNCSGLRARELVNDTSVYPIRGQVLRVYAPWIKTFYIYDPKRLADHGRYVYIFPQANGEVVLGGTGYQNDFNEKVNADDTRYILESTSEIVPSLKRAHVLGAWVGLRPGRPSVRLEKEVMKFQDKEGNEKFVKVVHNYGHGGGGWTVHWGCALDTTDLVFQFLAEGHRAKL